MHETMSSYEGEREKMASITMQIVIHAGDARNLIMETLDHAAGGLYDQAEDRLKETREELRQAHIFQIKVMQSEAGGKKHEYSLLFTRVQGAMMTICTGVNLAKEIISTYRKLDNRISGLEEKAKM